MVTATYGTIGGGYGNVVTATSATIGGGVNNKAGGSSATVGGGYYNTASGSYATVDGGYYNTASDSYATVSGGYGNIASGAYAMVPGGYSNTAQGNFSLAAGYRAKAPYNGCFVWGDSSTNAEVACASNDRWIIRSSGGYFFYSNSGLSTGVYLYSGATSWGVISDRAVKENFTPVDGKAVLAKVAALPLQEYNLKSQDPSIRHVGPVAQDFAAAFGYGESDRTINMEDADGVALAAIQGLYQLSQEQAAQIRQLEAENRALKQALAAEKITQQQAMTAMEKRIAALEAGRTPAASTNSPLPWLPGAGVLATAVGLIWLKRQGGER